MSVSNKILIVAGESSSAVYAQRLLEHWRDQKFPVEVFGVGSQAMEELGMDRIGRSEEMAVVGVQEVLGQLGLVYKVFRELLRRAKKAKPQVALLLDYPDFNLRLAKRLKKLGIPVVYYISPQLWAWRSSRVQIIKKYIDQMLVVFPFEEEFYRRHGVAVRFVGHPLLDELGTAPQRAFADSGVVKLGLMPGSRKSEVRHHLETQIRAAELFSRQLPHSQFELLVAPGLDREFVNEQLSRIAPQIPLTLIQEAPNLMIPRQDLILCASGTATLFVGLLERPFVVMYKMNRFSAFLAQRLIRTVEHFCIVNLILKKEALPEFFQDQASPENLSGALHRMTRDTQYREQIFSDLSHLKDLLGKKGATEQVSSALKKYWSSQA